MTFVSLAGWRLNSGENDRIQHCTETSKASRNLLLQIGLTFGQSIAKTFMPYVI